MSTKQKINEVNTVAIVGGGTSAWLTAALLSHELPHLQIAIIDKEIGTPVGVGEGTLLSFDRIMTRCGFDIDEWFFEIDATCKAGILFPGWGKNQEAVWHPFLFGEIPDKETTQYNVWSKNQEYDFKNYGLTFYDVSVIHDKVDNKRLNAYAFHIDAGKLVTYIQKKLSDRLNVMHIQSDVVDVLRNTEDDHINKLVLKNGSEIVADLYVDCTGFKAILGHDPQRVNLQGRLFCDTAIAAHVPYEDRDKELHPYVISEQVDHGWVWNIPVQTRIGSGLVFNRTQTDIEEAKDFLVKYWNNRIKKENLKVIDWTPYYNKNIWNKNVVSIGLSAGFIEPLESTGIALIIVGIEQLAFALDSRFYTEAHVNYYNNLMENYFEDAIDFVSMHYALPEKNTKFWNWVRDTWIKSERQKFYEKQLLRTDVGLPIKGTGYMFCASNWICWLIQMGYPINAAFDWLSPEQSLDVLMHCYSEEMKRKDGAPTHIEYLDNLKKLRDQDK
jgi:tryptophan halogenase